MIQDKLFAAALGAVYKEAGALLYSPDNEKAQAAIMTDAKKVGQSILDAAASIAAQDERARQVEAVPERP
jgi:hypothetical protein